MTRTTLAAALTATLTLLGPAAAQADTTITWSAQQLTATTDGGGDTVSLYTRELEVSPGSFHTFPAFSIVGPVTYPTGDCLVDNGYIVCSDSDSFVFQGAGGVDTFSISDEPELNAIPATLNGGGGSDNLKDFSSAGRTLDGGDGNDFMFGSDGDDTLRGGSGNDEVDGEGGSDNVSGGEGDDKLYGDHLKPPAPDVIDGGPGFDRIVDDWGVADGAVNATFDGLANDGRAGENDNLIGIESIEGPQGTYVGSAAAETFVVGAAGQATSVSGGGGNDTITTQNGPDVVDGGPGDDRITSGFDNDTVTGGPGRDAIFSDSTGNFCGIFSCTLPFGNDIINARDGEADTIDCGIGADRATTDTIDTHANCETVDAAVPPGPGPGPDPGASPLTVPAGRSIRVIARRGLTIKVACPGACTIRARLLADRKTARTLRLPRSRQLASARKTLLAAGTATLTLKVSKKARRRFARLRNATTTLKVTVIGADKKSTTLTRSLRLRR